jgi:vitamin B12 transporter
MLKEKGGFEMRKALGRGTRLLVFMSCFMLPVTGLAEESKEEEPVQKLEDIVVEERNLEESIAAESISASSLEEVGHHVEIITGEEMQEAGFVDLAKALETLVPGLFSSTAQGRGGYNIMRIHGSNEILWLLDGIRINAIHGALSHPWSYTLSVHMIDHIEILKGGEGLFYGTGARGGVINIITKKITEETSGELGTSYGGDDYREVYGHVTDTFDGHGLMAYVSHESYEGYNVADDQAYDDFQNDFGNKRIGSDRNTGGVKYRKAFDQLAGKAVLNAQYRRHEGYFDYPYPNYRTAVFDWNEEVSSLKWDHDLNDHFSYHLKTYLHKWWAELTTQNLDGSYLRYAEPVECDALGVNFMTSTRWGEGHEIITGIDYRNYYGSFPWAYDGNDFDRTQDYGLFASYRPYLAFSPDTKLSLSARHTMTSEDADSTVWDVSVRTPIVGQTYVRGSVRTDFTLPTLGQLSTNNPAQRTYGNPNLDPEESLDAQVGIGGEWRYFHFDVGYFYNEVENLIQTVVLANGDTTYENVDGETKFDGVEISAGVGPFNGFSFDVSATWISAEDNDTGEQLEQIPEFYSALNLKYRYKNGRFGADLMTRYTGDIYERDLGNHDDIEYGNYFVADASTFVALGAEKKHRITLRLENIFNKEYANGYTRSRAINGDYVVYQKYGLPRNVVLGYVYTF